LTEGRRAFKVRYKVRCGKRTVEVDVYRGPLEGLVTAEVEFPDEESAREFRPPDWLGREVTGDERYKNESLARYGAPEAEGASRDVPTEA
jgi:CYTH domain-containing protein